MLYMYNNLCFLAQYYCAAIIEVDYLKVTYFHKWICLRIHCLAHFAGIKFLLKL